MKTGLYLFVSLSGLFLVGCSIPAKVVLLNESGTEVQLEYTDEYSKPIVEILPVGGRIGSIQLFDTKFIIRTATLAHKYSPPGIPLDFVEHVGFGPFTSRIVKAQLEKNGCIYVIRPGEKYPTSKQSGQPEGFPICPNETK